jgi:hypothetical protein
MLTRIPRGAAILAGLTLSCIAAAAQNAAAHRPIYVCSRAAPVIFSDRPCGPLAETRVLHVPGPGPGSGPGRASSVASAPATDATRPRTEPRVADVKPVDRDDRCRQLREERRRLDDRMREGYPAREAARLWKRWREVDAKIYAARC